MAKKKKPKEPKPKKVSTLDEPKNPPKNPPGSGR
jgi:hypothetical protein